MSHNQILSFFTSVIMGFTTLCALAADKASVPAVHKHGKRIRMHEPMTTGMMKNGMMKGDVKNVADKKVKEMQPMMDQEEKSMPQDNDKLSPGK